MGGLLLLAKTELRWFRSKYQSFREFDFLISPLYHLAAFPTSFTDRSTARPLENSFIACEEFVRQGDQPAL